MNQSVYVLRNGTKITVELLHKLLDQYDLWYRVAEHFEISRNHLSVIRKILGVTRKSHGPRGACKSLLDPYKDQLRYLSEVEGLNVHQIVDLMDLPVGYKQVVKMIHRYGIEMAARPGAQPGSQNSAWRGGYRECKYGYRKVLIPQDHPFYCMADASGYVREHRLVMAEKIGRPLQDKEIVHHIDGSRTTNNPDNLMLFPDNAAHLRYEWSDSEWAKHQSQIRCKDDRGADNHEE